MEKIRLIGLLFLMWNLAGCVSAEKHQQEQQSEELSFGQIDNYGEVKNCQTSREYITTYNFLAERAEKFALEHDKIQSISDQVSKGCTGAAARFTKAFEILLRVGVGSHSALNVAMELSSGGEEDTTAFIEIFKRSYLEEYLDLDIKTSLTLARALSVDYAGRPQQALDDFTKFTNFCMESEKMNLPLVLCARVAGRVSKNAEKFDQGLSESFIQAFLFFKEDPSLQYGIADALRFAEKIVSVSPKAFDNFKMAYEFAISDQGLSLTNQIAVKFAQKLSDRTRNPNWDEDEMPVRIPAAEDMSDSDFED